MARSPSAKRVRRDAVAQRNARVTRRKVGQPVAAAPRGRAETELQMLLAQEQIRRVEIQQAFEERGAALESSTSAQDQLAAQLARACERNAELERALDDAEQRATDQRALADELTADEAEVRAGQMQTHTHTQTHARLVQSAP